MIMHTRRLDLVKSPAKMNSTIAENISIDDGA